MNDKYEEWQHQSKERQLELEHILKQSKEKDIVILYSKVALAFPTNNPHNKTFDYPVIDEKRLKNWCEKQGWDVRTAPEMTPEAEHGSPLIRFTRTK
jgi:hypothetical protein